MSGDRLKAGLGVAFVAALAAAAWSQRPDLPYRLLPQGLGPVSAAAFGAAWGRHALAVAALLLWLAALAGRGAAVRRWVGVPRALAPLAPDFGLALGFAVLGLGSWALGWTGLLFRPVLGALFLAVPAGWAARRRRPRVPRPARTWWWAAVAVPVLAALPGMLAPEASWDAMVYHLRLPADALLAHTAVLAPGTPFAGYPALLDAHYTLVLGLTGLAEVPKLLHAACWLLAARAIWLGARRFGESAAWVLALGWLTLPLGIVLAGCAYTDLGVAWPVALAAAAATAGGLHTGRGARLLGVLAGVAFGVKYTGAFLLVGLAAAAVGPGAGRALAGLAAGAAPVVGAWLVRNVALLDNPVYPFAAHALGGLPTPTLAFWLAGQPGTDAAAARGLLARLGAALFRDDGGIGAGPGPLWLALAGPAALLGPFSAGWMIFVAAAALWLWQPLDVRFLFPYLPAALVAAAAGWRAPWYRTAAGTALLLLGVTGAGEALYATTRQFDPIPPAFGLRAREDHLRQGLPPAPEYWRAAQAVNTRLPARARVFVLGGIKSFYIERRCAVAHQHIDPVPLVRRLREAGADPDRLAVRLRQDGLTHLLYLPRAATSIAAIPAAVLTPLEAAALARWQRTRTRPVFREGEAICWALTPRAAPRPLGRVPVLEEQALREAAAAGAPGPATAALARVAPESSSLATARGVTLLAAPPPRPGEAEAYLTRAVRDPEVSPLAWRALGFALDRLGERDRALAAYDRAAELNPADTESRLAAAAIRMRHGPPATP